MAKIVNYNYHFPLDIGKRGYFNFNQSVESAVKENIKNVLLTEKGSRICLGDFGTNIPGLLFDMKDAELKQKLKFEIVSAIDRWVPHCQITQVDIVFDDDLTPDNPYFGRFTLDPNQVMIFLFYNVISTDGNFFVPDKIALII